MNFFGCQRVSFASAKVQPHSTQPAGGPAYILPRSGIARLGGGVE
jgi:hypothetical protein